VSELASPPSGAAAPRRASTRISDRVTSPLVPSQMRPDDAATVRVATPADRPRSIRPRPPPPRAS
jgi:hypothetical protein